MPIIIFFNPTNLTPDEWRFYHLLPSFFAAASTTSASDRKTDSDKSEGSCGLQKWVYDGWQWEVPFETGLNEVEWLLGGSPSYSLTLKWIYLYYPILNWGKPPITSKIFGATHQYTWGLKQWWSNWWYTYPPEQYEFVSWDFYSYHSQYMECHKIPWFQSTKQLSH